MILQLALVASLAPQNLVLEGVRVYTGTGAEFGPRVVAIDGRIALADAPPPAGAEHRKLPGYVLPGLHDAHAHLQGLGAALENVDLVGTKSFDEVIARVRARAATTPKGEWILGRGWDQNDWEDKRFPEHAALSAAVPDHPVWLTRVDGHAALANGQAMAQAGLTSATVTPNGGEIVKDSAGAPTAAEAIAGFTRDAAHAAFLEQDLGTVAPGKRADFTVMRALGIDPTRPFVALILGDPADNRSWPAAFAARAAAATPYPAFVLAGPKEPRELPLPCMPCRTRVCTHVAGPVCTQFAPQDGAAR